MIAKITHAVRAQMNRPFTRDDAWMMISCFLPLGCALVLLGAHL